MTAYQLYPATTHRRTGVTVYSGIADLWRKHGTYCTFLIYMIQSNIRRLTNRFRRTGYPPAARLNRWAAVLHYARKKHTPTILTTVRMLPCSERLNRDLSVQSL